jgi:CheY-like chemotaxis protein
MPKVLVVEDSTTDRRVVGFLLKRAGQWEVDYALHGKEALEKLTRTPFDLILTDLVMPAMDGLELVAAVRREHPHVPVVLMTSRGNEGIALLALEAGAVSYIPKRLLPRNLEDTLNRVMVVSAPRRFKGLPAHSLTDHRSTFVLDNDLAALRALIAYLQESTLLLGICDQAECVRVGVALDEALTNAVYHGNLEVGAGAPNDKEFQELVEQRRRDAPYCNRRIRVTAMLTPHEAIFAIADEGCGFNPSVLPAPSDLSTLEKVSGRGIVLMRLFMDEVAFDELGRQVVLVKRRKS